MESDAALPPRRTRVKEGMPGAHQALLKTLRIFVSVSGFRIDHRALAGRHADIASTCPAYLGTAGQAPAAGSRVYSRSEIAAMQNAPVRGMRPPSATRTVPAIQCRGSRFSTTD